MAEAEEDMSKLAWVLRAPAMKWFRFIVWIKSLNPNKNPMHYKGGSAINSVLNEVACLESQSKEATDLGFTPKLSWKAVILTSGGSNGSGHRGWRDNSLPERDI